MSIDYDHAANLHTIEGPRTALPKLFPGGLPASILDVGCGTGIWLRSALDCGVSDVIGIDGVKISSERLRIPPELFIYHNLNSPVDLGRRFEVAICLEVAEHIEPKSSRILIQTLTKHADRIVFSAACPGQAGQHHVNCQWPGYWQDLFNQCGFVCSDNIRWQIWDDQNIEPWYRQNLFFAQKDPERAGMEPRIHAVVHPEINKMMLQISATIKFPDTIQKIEQGWMPAAWYAAAPFRALKNKMLRKLFKK